MFAGVWFTVIVSIAEQPVLNVYDIFAVPVEEQLIIPLIEPIGATDPLLLDHVPPAVASLNVIVVPRHAVWAPVIAAGHGLIVTVTLPSVPQQPYDDSGLK